MKLERLEDYVKPTIALIVGLWLAVMCGYMVGNGDAKIALIIVAAIAVIAFLVKLQETVWMLIPATWMLGGKVSVLPLPFTVAHIGILMAFAMFLFLKALKVVRIKPKGDFVEVWMLIVLFYVATVYIRNPVGVDALDSERVGGRPYAEIIIACLGYWVLARSIATPRQAHFACLLGVIGSSFHAVANAIAYRFPSTIGPLANLYSGIEAAENQDPWAAIPEQRGRLTYLSSFAGSLMNMACSLWRPLTLINPLNFFRFLIFAASLAMTLLSGFRSNLMGTFEIFLICSYFRGGVADAMRTLVGGGSVVALLCVVQGNLIDLPLPAQRALSFLPGKWEYAAKAEAEGSTEWRVTMWKTMMEGNKYIENKWFGDGFGFTRYQLATMMANAQSRSIQDQQENLMISGGVHSGPISSIRYIGYLGLVLLLIFMVSIGVRSIRIIHRAKDTPFFSLALVNGAFTVLWPLNFVFIFGAPENDLPTGIITAGMQILLQNSLVAYEGLENKSAPEMIQAPKIRRASELIPVGRR